MSPASVSSFVSNRVKISAAVDDNDDFTTLRAVCVLLQSLAQKYVPDAAFEDRASLIQCLNVMQELGIDFSVKAKLAQMFEEKDIDRCSLSYRLLKNRAIAALSTIADLDKKCLDRRGGEYKNGMRDAYRRASDVAVMFLEEIQGDTIAQPQGIDSLAVYSKPRCRVV